MKRQAARKHTGGFTLLEMMLALLVFAMLSVGAYGVFNGVLTNDEISRRRIARLTELVRAMDQLNSDFSQVLERSVRSEGQRNTNVIDMEIPGWKSEDAAIIFVRNGWLNPGSRLRRSELQRVGYRLYEGELQRFSWIYTDIVSGTTPTVTTLIQEVNTFEIRYYYGGQWNHRWQRAGKRPQAIEITLDLKDYGLLRRKFLLAVAEENQGIINEK